MILREFKLQFVKRKAKGYQEREGRKNILVSLLHDLIVALGGVLKTLTLSNPLVLYNSDLRVTSFHICNSLFVKY